MDLIFSNFLHWNGSISELLIGNQSVGSTFFCHFLIWNPKNHKKYFLKIINLCFKEPELLEPLMPSIRSCLEHRHSYVRRNAVLAIFTIYKNFEFLIPDAPELISNFLEGEQDMSCKR